MPYQVFFKSHCFATPTAVTVLVNGKQVFSGQVGNGFPLSENFDSDPIDTGLELGETASISISCTSGVLNTGPWLTVKDPWWVADLRVSDSILINGQPPEVPATPVGHDPVANSDTPDWTGWFFELSAGETISFNIKIPNKAWVNPAIGR